MSSMRRDVGIGEVMVFDKDTRTLYLVHRDELVAYEEANELEAVKRLAREGKAHVFDRSTLQKIQIALAEVILLQPA